MTKPELENEMNDLRDRYARLASLSLSLDLSRGKPAADQLNLTEGLLTAVSTSADTIIDGTDTRNYGVPDGLPAMKKIFSDLFTIPESNIIIGGASSLRLMFDTVARAMLFGTSEGKTPWAYQGKIKFICPVPGYDRHFGICEAFGIEMITVPMTKDGPDMDRVEALVASDASIKGIWCVPKYSNPTGVTYSNETVKRLASLKCAADDFRIFYDNAYAIHDLYDKGDELADIFAYAKEAGNPDIVYEFSSFAKISFPGGGVSMFASSDANVAYARKILSKQTICCDKINQLRHIRYFGDADGVRAHMKKHASLLRPKFEIVRETFERELAPYGVGEWTNPNGGYFLSLDLPKGTAKRTYELAKNIGVTLTKVGATFPYGIDPDDSNLRIAPTFATLDNLRLACEVLCVCAKIAALEKMI